MSRARILVILPLALMGIVGCAASEEPSSAPPVTSVSTPSPTPESTKTPATSAPELETPELSTEGYGYILIGQPVPAQHEGPELIEWDTQLCDGWGAWFPTGASGHAWEDVPVASQQFMVDSPTGVASDPITAIVVVGADGPTTDRGIGVGSTESELLAAYTEADRSFDYGDGQAQYNVTGVAGRLQFFVSEGVVAQVGLIDASLSPDDTRIGPTGWFAPCS